MAESALKSLLEQITTESPAAVENLSSGLSQAADEDQAGIDRLRGYYDNPANFTVNPLQMLGKGLTDRRSGGRFSDNLSSGLDSWVDAQNFNKQQNLTREEKLAAIASAQANLTRQRAQDPLAVLDASGKVANNMTVAGNQLSDFNLTPPPPVMGKMPAGKFGPPNIDSSPEGNARAILDDYTKNPQKYAGPQGQAMVARAIDMYNSGQNRQVTIDRMNAQNRKGRDLTTVDKKAILEAKQKNKFFEYSYGNLKRAMELGPKSWGGPMTGTRARMSAWLDAEPGSWADTAGNWIGLDDKESANSQIEYSQIMQGEAIKQMAETLKGATTDREMQKFIDIVADDSIPWGTAKENAVRRVMDFIESEVEGNNAIINDIGSGDYYTNGQGTIDLSQSGAPGGGNRPSAEDLGLKFDPNILSDEDMEWVKRQEAKGVSMEQIVEELNREYGTE